MVSKRDGEEIKKIGGLIIAVIFVVWFLWEGLHLIGLFQDGSIMPKGPKE